jgi:hypothetical protein
MLLRAHYKRTAQPPPFDDSSCICLLSDFVRRYLEEAYQADGTPASLAFGLDVSGQTDSMVLTCRHPSLATALAKGWDL